MNLRRACVVVVILAGWLWANRALAENISPEAKRHVDLAVQHYQAQRWKEASEEFDLAYRLSHRPALLFNIARCEAKLGHDEATIAFLRKYLEEAPDAPDAPAVLAEIQAREQSLAAAKAKAAAEAEAKAAKQRAEVLQAEENKLKAERQQPPPPAAVVAPAQPPVEAPHRESHALRWTGVSLLVIGPALVGVGIGLGVVAQQAANDLMKASGSFSMNGASIQSRGRTADAAGIALDVVGGAVAVTGAVLLGVSYRSHGAAAQAWLAPAGTGVVAGGKF